MKPVTVGTPPGMLYFAYGSNLNRADLRPWCKEQGYKYPFARVVTRAFLPDHEYIFNATSSRRGGGVLNLRKRTAQAVHGVVFEVKSFVSGCLFELRLGEPQDGWEALDKKEGAPYFYRRVPVTVFDEYGEPLQAMTYRVRRRSAESKPVPASEPYLEVVKQGLRERGLLGEAQLDAAARGEIVPLITDRLFVYGTLMAGEPQELRIQPDEDVISWVPATAPGKLYALGDLPCLRPAKDSIVHGECIQHKNLDALFLDIDFYEGFRGYHDLQHSLYYRALTFCETKDGKHLAWAYFARSVKGAVEVPSGDWRSR
jgi:gamma-glutamylcyclotransferase (GGCT)/AIG2-like uncharacterized protein YtfP